MLLESDAHGGIDSGQHARQIVAAGDLFEAFAVERVEMDVEAAQTGVVERLRLLFEQHGVGGERDVANARNARRGVRSAAADRAAAEARRR